MYIYILYIKTYIHMIYDIWYMIDKAIYIWCILKKLICTSHEWSHSIDLIIQGSIAPPGCAPWHKVPWGHQRSCRSNRETRGTPPSKWPFHALSMGVTNDLLTGMILQVGGGFKHLFFTPTWEIWSDLTKIFQVGWNHQLEKQPKGENIGDAPWCIVTDLDFQRRWTDPRRCCKISHPVHPIDWGHCEVFGTQARTNSGLAFLGSWSFNFHSILFVVGVCIWKLNSLNFNAPSF